MVILKKKSGRPANADVEDDVLISEYEKIGNSAKVAKKYGVSTTLVLNVIRRHGLRVNKSGAGKKFSNTEVKRMKQLYNSGKSQRDIATIFGISQQGVGKMLKRVNCAVRKTKAEIDEYFFHTIDSEEKAYWLGFLSADGNIGKDNAIRLELQREDGMHVALFAETIGSRNIYVREGSRSEVGVQSKSIIMANELRKKGLLTGKKSFVLKPYDCGSELQRHYWRGFFDGDGYISSRGLKKRSIGVCGTREMCEGFRKFMKDNGVSTSAKVCKEGNLFNFSIESKEIVKCVTILYKDSCIHLERKKCLADELQGIEVYQGVRKISRSDAMLFFKTFHYLKNTPIGVINYGYFEEGKLIAVAAVGSPSSPALEIQYSGQCVELRRFALLKNAPNLASKVLAAVVRVVKKEYVGKKNVFLSFADGAQGHEGTIYKAIGMNEVSRGSKQLVGVIGDTKLTGVHLQRHIADKGIDGIVFEESVGKIKYELKF